uniref:Cyclic nucleotide-binding domain-containing protein n=1 Tax=Pyrodinium bahamense TaxID=73915 RepID=A0A7S0A2D9_9DINO
MKLSLAMKNYLRTWFLPDMALVTCDWMTAWTLRDSRWVVQGMRVMRLVRGGRQVVRVWTLVQKARLMIQMKAFHLVMDIALLLLVILWVNHVVCCGWYSIGRYIKSDTGSTWLSHEEFSAAGTYYEYWTSLHWAITQMTPGSMEVFPESSEERIYSVSTLFLGLLMGSSLVATLTSMMTQYKLRIEASSRKFMQLHQFLNQQGVDPQLALAIKLQVKARSSERQRLQVKDVEYLSLVSNSLQEALWHSWCMKHLSGHTFLNSLNLLDSFAVQCLCNSAIKALDYPASDLVFEEGAPGDCMYFLVNGQLRYTPGELAPEVSLCELDPKLTLDPGSWCSEPALWTVWTHLGTLEASSTSELLSIEGSKLLPALERFPSAMMVLVDYCATFHRYINESGVLRSDLAYGFDINELVSGLNTETRIKLANPVIHSLQVHFWDKVVNQRCIELLKDEVANGKCDMGFVGAEPVRNTFVVALCLRKSRGATDRFLVKVGEVLREGSEVVSSCLLPGVKRKRLEAYKAAVQRLLGLDLGEIASQVEMHFEEGFEQTVVMSPSPTYGIRTRYLRTTFQAVLAPGAKLSTVRAPENLQPPAQPSSFKKLFRPDVARASQVEQQTAAVLAAHTSAVVLHCDETNRASRKLYLWLDKQEFEVLSHAMAKPVIQQWVASLEAEREPAPGTNSQGTEGSAEWRL